MATVFLGLGSNLGNREKALKAATKRLNDKGIRIEKTSSFIETDPVGGPPQEKYLNAVVQGRTELDPHELLSAVKNIENELGRTPTVRNGPRLIDIDILLYDDLHMKSPCLTIPHPRMAQRHFVMQPLQEIAPHLSKEFQDADH